MFLITVLKMKSDFHTIKSILNSNNSSELSGYVTDFHTIKSILNMTLEYDESIILDHFHTIKSILNQELYHTLYSPV